MFPMTNIYQILVRGYTGFYFLKPFGLKEKLG